MIKIELEYQDAVRLLKFMEDRVSDPYKLDPEELKMWDFIGNQIGPALYNYTDGTFTSEAEWDRLAALQEPPDAHLEAQYEERYDEA